MPIKVFYKMLLACLIFLQTTASAQIKDPLPRSYPEAEGVASSDILQFLDTVAKSKNEFHSLMILRHGKVIAEGWWNPYNPALRHTMYSTSKSFTSSAVGFAVAEGKIKLSDHVVSYFPSDLPAVVTPALAALTLKDLITMTVGQRPDPTFATMQQSNWARYFLSLPIVDSPGHVFLYNSVSPYMLSAIVQKVTGEKIIDYLKPRLFAPLGIEGMDWETSPQLINSGGWGLRIKTEDMAKFGQLYLQQGNWKGKQILPKSWIQEATTFKIDQDPKMTKAKRDSNDWAQGYCYQFWRCRHNAFRADGAFGQYIIMMPDQDAVVVITSETANMQDELNLVWTYLLPAFRKGKLPDNTQDEMMLKQKLSSLSLSPGQPSTDPPLAATISSKTYQTEPNDMNVNEMAFGFDQGRCTLQLRTKDSTYRIVAGNGKWILGETRLAGTPPSLIRPSTGPYFDFGPVKTAVSYSWQDENDLVLTVRYIESPHTDLLLCHFEADKVTLSFDGSLNRMMHMKPGKILHGTLKP